MKKTFTLLILLLFSVGISAQSGTPEEVVTFRFVPGDDMFYTPWNGNGEELSRLYELIDVYRADIADGKMPINVDAYSSSMRDTKANLNLSFLRANRVKSDLILKKSLKEEHFITKNYTVPYEGNRDIVVVTLRIPVKEEPKKVPVAVEEIPAKQEAPFAAVEPKPEPLIDPVAPPSHKGLDIRTNLLYDVALTPTLGLEWRINNHIGIKVDGSWAHWGSSKGRVQKMWFVSPEVRWYLLKDKRFYVGLGANIGEANVYRGLAKVLSKDTGYQGNFYGGGVTVGYRLPLCGSFAMDFNLGLGVTHFKYDTFTVSNEVRVYKGRDVSKNFWGPTQAGVTLIWRVGGKK